MRANFLSGLSKAALVLLLVFFASDGIRSQIPSSAAPSASPAVSATAAVSPRPSSSAAITASASAAVSSPTASPAADKNASKAKKGVPAAPLTDAEKKAAEDEKKKKSEDFEKAADIKKAEWIEKTMDFGMQKDRRDALNFIPTVKNEEKKKLLYGKLIKTIENDTDSTILIKAITIASELKLSEATASIKVKLFNENDDVRISAVYALKDINAVECKTEIIEILKKQDFAKASIFTESMIQTLAEFKAVELREFAEEKIKDNKTIMSLRLQLILYLGRSGSVASKDFLLTHAKDQNEEVEIRSYAVNALARLELKETAPDIAKILDEIAAYPFQKKKQYANLQLHCITALVKLGDDSAYPRLIESLKNDNASTRIRAINLIKDLKDKRAIDILKYKVQYDPSVQVQKAAKAALKAMDVDVDEDKSDAKKGKTGPAVKPETPKKDAAEPADSEDKPDVKKRDDF
jgi:HEAT repeat protein